MCADNSLLLCKATIFKCLHIQEILQVYEQASSQKLNRYKTSIFFNSNTKPKAKAHIIGVARVNANQQYEKYLGLVSPYWSFTY